VSRVASLLLVCVAGCTPTATLRPDQLSPESLDTRFELFAVTGRWTADSLRVVSDTLFARAIAVHPAADRTPIALPILMVDSIRPAHTDRSALTATLLPAALIAALGVGLSLAWGND
jgi:hypothetical protein